MTLVIFDIDGTLTQTDQADGDCFVSALADVFGFRDVNTDWSTYRHATDAGILHEIHTARTGRAPGAAEIARFRQRFIERLTEAGQQTGFAPVPGAAAMLALLAQSPDHRVALATGAWQDSARLKMTGAGLNYHAHPAASSDDALDRETIIRTAVRRAAMQFGQPTQTLYVGDGVWDARACRNLGLPFIGIGQGPRAERLMAEGAVRVFADYSDPESFMDALDGWPR